MNIQTKKQNRDKNKLRYKSINKNNNKITIK